jgi:hypothetical protein
VAGPLAVATWLAGFRLRIDDSGIEYRDLFSKSFKVAYSEIQHLRLETYSAGRTYWRWVLHLSDGRTLTKNLKPFARTALDVLRGRIHVVDT